MNVRIVDIIVLYCTVRPFFEEGKIKLCKKMKGTLQHFGISVKGQTFLLFLGAFAGISWVIPCQDICPIVLSCWV